MAEQHELHHEAAWRLVLFGLWENPDVEVVCKLLCCSKAMEELVHSTCAGRLMLSLGGHPTQFDPHPAVKPSSPVESSFWSWHLMHCRWLAKHARLCRELHILACWSHQDGNFQPSLTEEHLVAGLAAAAGQHSVSAVRTRRAAAAAEAAVAIVAREAAAAGPSRRLYQQQQQEEQGLLLEALDCALPSDGSVLCCIAGHTQLTSLKLSIHQGAAPAVGCRHALASLSGLKELELGMGYRPYSPLFVPRDLPVFDCLAPALKQLTGLTKLQVSGIRFKPQHLPTSLLELHASRLPGAAQTNWRSLQSVTRLVLGSDDYEVSQREANLQQGDVLPPRLQHLQLSLSGKRHGTVSLLPVLQLSHLTGLSLQMRHGVYPAQVQQLVGMLQLKALDVSCHQVRDARGILELGQALSPEALPLKYFGVHWANFLASTNQPCRHLTRLDLSHIDLLSNREIQQLGEQLRHLPALHTFHVRIGTRCRC